MLAFAPVVSRADDRLMHALVVLNQRVSLPEESSRAARAAIEVPIGIFALTSALALATRAPRLNASWLGGTTRWLAYNSGRASVYAVPVGAAFWAAARAVSLVEFWRDRQSIPAYDSARALRRFLRRPLDEQYIIANRDPAFANYLVTFGESFDVLDRGFTAAVAP